MFIKKLKLKNFKKYKDLEISFNKNINVIIGENESGKSTILQAIDLVISGNRNKIENIGLEYLFNKNVVQDFYQNKQLQNLPKLEIELYFENYDDPDFWGENNSEEKSEFGIFLKCEPRDDLSREISSILVQEINNFPFEFYTINFYKFSGSPYLGFTRKFKHILIDHSSINNEFATNSYIKTLYSSSIESTEKSIHSNKYRMLKTEFKNSVLNNLNKQIPGQAYEFSLKSLSRSSLESDLTISEDNIDILHRGKGRQCFIKTEYALSKNENELDFILLEEPENHLSHLNMHNLISRINLSRNKQIFIATHSNLISSRLDLRNSIFITSNNEFNIKLSDLSPETAKFFVKAPNKNLLEFILSNKVILVEGDAEYILIEKLFEQKYYTLPTNLGIHIIAVGGLSFKRYMEISNLLNIKTVVIRDNDKSFENNIVENYKDFISPYTNVFASTNDDEYTFEIAIHNCNVALCEAIILPRLKTRTVIDFMLAEKTEAAYMILNSNENIQIPEYINRAFEWLVND